MGSQNYMIVYDLQSEVIIVYQFSVVLLLLSLVQYFAVADCSFSIA